MGAGDAQAWHARLHTLPLATSLPQHPSSQVMDALAMTYPDNTFDLVWACESGEHMPDKKK